MAPKKNPDTGSWDFVVDLGPGPDRNGVWRERRQAKRRGYPTKRLAQEALVELRSRSRQGELVHPSAETFGQWMGEWLDAVTLRVKPSTADFYRRCGENHVIARLGSIPLQRIDPAVLNRYYLELLDRGRSDGGGGLSVTTVRHIHVIIGAALDAAVKARRTTVNPARHATPASARSTEQVEMTTWDAGSVARFLDAEAGTRSGPAFTFLALTGCRRGEALGLTWPDVDLEAAQVSIRRSITEIDGAIHRSGSTKTGKGRSIRLQPDLVAALRSWRARQAAEQLRAGSDYSEEDLVFCHPDGRPYHPSYFSREFERRLTRHGLPVIRLHDLRHTYATWALQAGVPVKVVADRLGHSSVMVTLDPYSHVMPAVEAEHADTVANLIAAARLP